MLRYKHKTITAKLKIRIALSAMREGAIAEVVELLFYGPEELSLALVVADLKEVTMHGILFGFILAGIVISGASAADLGYAPYEYEAVYVDEAVTYVPRRVHTVKRITCVKCRGARLPYGGLRDTYQAQLPYGGLPEYCPPTLETRQVRQVILVRKG